jgi:short-subunit dehydrogenase
MTHVLLPDMVKRGKGIVVNISSAAGDAPTPLLSVYSATKVCVYHVFVAACLIRDLEFY